jgi:hypothetical protein
MSFSQLEKEILDWFVSHNKCEALQQQCAQAFVMSREYTGVGMFINLSCPADLPKVDVGCAPNAPLILSPLLKHGAGVDLWFESGRIHYIEIVAFGEVHLPESYFPYSLVDSL